MNNPATSWGGAGHLLPETSGDLVSRFRNASTGARKAGLDELCRRYWKPIYSFIRMGWSKSNDDAKDLTQAFFLSLLEGDALRRYEAERASFRTFLKALLRHFLSDQEKARQRLKRGGGVHTVDLDASQGLAEKLMADPRSADPDKAFDAAWRWEVVTRAVARVRERHAADTAFKAYEGYDLASPSERPTYGELAARLGVKESDVLHALATLREEVRAEIRAEILDMVSGPQEFEEEWNAFLGS
jgi:RNA polymerase sigma-70 factor (ECF subfamily)